MRTFLSLLAILASLSGQQPPSPATLLIVGGTVIDGTGSSGRPAAVRVQGDTIVELEPNLKPLASDQVIDASGFVVAPGFIDMHSHADRGIADRPDARSQVLQGITTALVGQDGGSALPVSEFLKNIEQVHPTINYATSIGHGTVRSAVLGADFKRAATPAEIETMKALVDRGMRDGAVGLSSGLEYDPGFYAHADEVMELARVAARYGGFFSTHVRDEENDVMDAWREAIDVGRRAQVPVQISHAKLASKAVWGTATHALKLIDEAHRQGVAVMADWYPYTYWQSGLYVLLPDRDFENRVKWRIALEEIGGAQNILVTGFRPDPSYNGRTIAAIAAGEGTDPVSLIIRMIRDGGPAVGIIGTAMIEADLEQFVAHPQVLICSDGGISGRHPRGYGAFPRVLARYVREIRAVSLAEAIAKMTGRSAKQIGLQNRGVIAPGHKADIVVFDADRIQDRGTPQQPDQDPIGMRHVIVNGQLVLHDGEMTSARPGLALRRQSAAAQLVGAGS